MIASFSSHWWLWLIRGILAILFGVMALAMPALTLVTLVLIFGIYAFADGLTAIWGAIKWRAWWLILVGLLGLLVAFYTFVYPGVTGVALLYLIAIWAIVRGIIEIIAAIQLRKEITNEWLLVIGGILSIIFGVILAARPAAGALAMVWVIGVYALVFGGMMIALAFRLKGRGATVE